jgi:hypothetical protein
MNFRSITSRRCPSAKLALLAEAGFGDAWLFYAGLWVYGWIARA